jgi:hypothetical protein
MMMMMRMTMTPPPLPAPQVTYVWSKCDTDPACCCAELATEGSVRVDFKPEAEAQDDEVR